jgi:hypothetical protein
VTLSPKRDGVMENMRRNEGRRRRDARSDPNPDVSAQLRAFQNAAPEVGRAFCQDGNFTIRIDS